MNNQIIYHLDIIDPNTQKIMGFRDRTFTDWSDVEKRINQDKAQFVDRSKLHIKYTAQNQEVQLSGSFGA